MERMQLCYGVVRYIDKRRKVREERYKQNERRK